MNRFERLVLCPRIEIPARGECCQHPAVFDLRSFLHLLLVRGGMMLQMEGVLVDAESSLPCQDKDERVKCPFCPLKLRVRDLVVDGMQVVVCFLFQPLGRSF